MFASDNRKIWYSHSPQEPLTQQAVPQQDDGETSSIRSNSYTWVAGLIYQDISNDSHGAWLLLLCSFLLTRTNTIWLFDAAVDMYVHQETRQVCFKDWTRCFQTAQLKRKQMNMEIQNKSRSCRLLCCVTAASAVPRYGRSRMRYMAEVFFVRVDTPFRISNKFPIDYLSHIVKKNPAGFLAYTYIPIKSTGLIWSRLNLHHTWYPWPRLSWPYNPATPTAVKRPRSVQTHRAHVHYYCHFVLV